MLLNKVKKNGIDLFILIKDKMKNLYVPHPFMFHANYDSFQLIFKFEDWSEIINDGKEHIQTIAEYVNADNGVLCKWQSEDFDELLNMIKEWNNKHRISNNESKKIKSFWDFIDTLKDGTDEWRIAMDLGSKYHKEGKNSNDYLDEIISKVKNI